MGISADLIMIDKDGEFELQDLNQPQTLYEYLPSHLHSLIEEKDIEIIEIHDIETYREMFGEDIYIYVEYPHGAIRLSNGMLFTEPLTVFKKCNTIKYKVLKHIGGKEKFKSFIYELYKERTAFPYLWTYDEMNIILSDEKEKNNIRCLVETYNIEDIYINLNY